MNKEAVQATFTISKPKSALLQVSRAQRADATADDTLRSRINLCRPTGRGASLRVPRRGPVERGLAGCGTEVIRLASIDGAARGPLRIDHHPAHRIFFHASPPAFFAVHSCGLNRRSVIEFITTDTELKPMAAPAMIGLSTIPMPANTPAAIGMSAVL